MTDDLVDGVFIAVITLLMSSRWRTALLTIAAGIVVAVYAFRRYRHD